MDQGGWSAIASFAWLSAGWIEPGRDGEVRIQPATLNGLSDPRCQQVTIVADLIAHPSPTIQLGHITIGNDGEPSFPPMIEPEHEMASEGFNQSLGDLIPKTFILQRSRKRM